MQRPRRFGTYSRVTVSLPPKLAALIGVVAEDFEDNFSAFVARAIEAYASLKVGELAADAKELHVELLHRQRLEEIQHEKELLELQERVHADAERKAIERKQKREAKRALIAAAAPKPVPKPKFEPAPERPEPVTFEEHVQECARILRRHPGEATEAHVRREAKKNGFDETHFLLECRVQAGQQSNLRVLPAVAVVERDAS